MYCPQCAAQLVDNDKFCRACGADLKAAALALATLGRGWKITAKNWQEKRMQGIRKAVQGAIMTGASLLSLLGLYIAIGFPDVLVAWLFPFAWLAILGIIFLTVGVKTINKADRIGAKATLPQPVDNRAPVPDTDPLDNSGLPPMMSVSENTTRSLEPIPKEYVTKE